MLKYVDYSVVFQEVPNEISLAFTISNCQGNCPGCHSPHLRQDIGHDLERDLPDLLDKYDGMITCVLFLGEGNDPDALWNCIEMAHRRYRTALYSGKESVRDVLSGVSFFGSLDYLKVGSYKEECGPISSPTTNQRFYSMMAIGNQLVTRDDTHLFWRKAYEDSSKP